MATQQNKYESIITSLNYVAELSNSQVGMGLGAVVVDVVLKAVVVDMILGAMVLGMMGGAVVVGILTLGHTPMVSCIINTLHKHTK